MIAALVTLVALAAVAGEGRTPIYQWHNPITKPGKYIVTRDIVPLACAAPVIDIQIPAAFPTPAGYVDIDLNGFRVNACGADAVIRAIGHDNIIVRNGTLGYATHGIHIVGDPATGNRKVVIEDVKIMDVSNQGIFLEGITDFAIRRTNVVTSDFFLAFGIGFTQTGILIDAAGRPIRVKGTIEDSQVERTAGGIVVRDGAAVAIKNNRVAELFAAGPGAIVYDVSSAGLISENTVENIQGGSGIFLGDSQGSKIYNNVVREVEKNGIHLAGFSDDNLVLDNVVTLSGADGLRVEGSRNHIERNVLNVNGFGGVASWGLHFAAGGALGSNTYGRNTAHGNPGPPGACPFGGGPNPPTFDFCDEGPGALSWADNFMPFLF
jgi:hypothetical protein